MIRRHFEIGETAVTIMADEEHICSGEESILRSRDAIQRFIHHDPFFRSRFEPYDPPKDAFPIIGRMCDAAEKAGVGPMASIAGAIAEQAVVDMMDHGAEQAVVDNGGDIALLLRSPINVALYCGAGLRGIGFRCQPREGVWGLCTSSATIGPSISLGCTDASTVISSNVALADAVATRLGNLVTSMMMIRCVMPLMTFAA